MNNPFSANYFNSYNLTPPINPTLAKTTGCSHRATLTARKTTNGPNTGGGSNFGDHQTTVDNLSKGVEIELSAQPLRNWNVTLNYTHVNATHTDIDPAMQAFISQVTGFMNGPGGLDPHVVQRAGPAPAGRRLELQHRRPLDGAV